MTKCKESSKILSGMDCSETIQFLDQFTYYHQKHKFSIKELTKAAEIGADSKKKCTHAACRLNEYKNGKCYLHYKKREWSLNEIFDLESFQFLERNDLAEICEVLKRHIVRR